MFYISSTLTFDSLAVYYFLTKQKKTRQALTAATILKRFLVYRVQVWQPVDVDFKVRPPYFCTFIENDQHNLDYRPYNSFKKSGNFLEHRDDQKEKYKIAKKNL